MKVSVTVLKAGKQLFRAEIPVSAEEGPSFSRAVEHAIAQFHANSPEHSLLDDDVSLQFGKVGA